MSASREFYDHLNQIADSQGFIAPNLLLVYLADMLTLRLDRVDIIPEPSFAERYLALYAEHDLSQFKDYADSALFFVSLMPDYGRRRGLDMDYYATLGISTYYSLADLSNDHRYTELGNWFYYLQRFLATALHHDRTLQLVKF
jgi:hypothetical protein